ncbi:centrosomal protein of 104 kDa-like [Selaginella moellendorffii]|uniref:centrosomal protein of 104 kDa-like n=1 Tax=Selaginella moellendorffii TaxID=88036 RepID=UPI000D1C5BCE|nr:centrosomal protein of 104 kDa-like [Selaginella moellendorffii]|eukprot:XP_024540141.1 centrosomal protein of 104 kDa-like [Selaginella moellendorffii]
MVRICLINSVEDVLHEKVKDALKMDDPFEDERRLPFSVVSCSGQDDDFPANELSKGASGRGWQAQRFCEYPQELVIELQWPSHVFTMQLLCHEYKISSKVEIFASVLANEQMSSKQMKRLGHLSLDPNERTGFQARELKSIQINAPASSLRLVLHNCYSNKLNVYNQVGIVALVVTGDPLSEEQIIMHQLRHTIPSESPRQKILEKKTKPRGGVSESANVDCITGQRIQRLQQEKQQAVEEEDYDEAKRLKLLIEKLKTLGQKIKELERKKKLAVEEEDYDQAKYCKLEIEKLRQLNSENSEDETSDMGDLSNVIPCSAKNTQNDFNGVAHRESRDSSTQTSEQVSEDEYKEELPIHGIDDNDIQQTVEQTSGTLAPEPVSVQQEDRPTYRQALHEDTVVTEMRTSQDDQSSNSDEVLTPEPLPETVVKEFSDVLTVMDRYHLECLLSKHWQLRDKSLQVLEKELESKSHMSDTVTSFRAIHKVVTRGLNDRVSNVFFSSIQVLRAYVTRYAAEVQSRELHSCLGDIASILRDKLGDSNARTKEAAGDTLMFFAMVKEAGLNVIAPLMLKVPKTLALWKPILGRLQWLLVGIPKFGLQPQGRSGSPGFATEPLMHFVVHCFNYPNGEVRSAAMKVTTEVYKIIGLGVEKFLKGVKPVIREVIVGLFEKTGEELSASCSMSKVSPLKAATENPKQGKGFRSSEPSPNTNLLMSSSSQTFRKGKTIVDGFERQSCPQPEAARNRYADRLEVSQSSSSSSSSWIDAAGSDFTQRSGKASSSKAAMRFEPHYK